MGYRGSKSVTGINIPVIHKAGTVKEQRVDGHRCVKLTLTHLRYALMGFERNYQIRIPSNQLITSRPYTSLARNQLSYLSGNLNPWFLAGFYAKRW